MQPAHLNFGHECLKLAKEAREKGHTAGGSIVVRQGKMVGRGLEGAVRRQRKWSVGREMMAVKTDGQAKAVATRRGGGSLSWRVNSVGEANPPFIFVGVFC